MSFKTIKEETLAVLRYAFNWGKISIGHSYHFFDDASTDRILYIPIEVHAGMVKCKVYSTRLKEILQVRMVKTRTFRAFYKLENEN